MTVPSDDLRTRIAAAIAKVVVDRDLDVRHHALYDMADAVIREVLTPEFLADLVIQAVQKAAADE